MSRRWISPRGRGSLFRSETARVARAFLFVVAATGFGGCADDGEEASNRCVTSADCARGRSCVDERCVAPLTCGAACDGRDGGPSPSDAAMSDADGSADGALMDRVDGGMEEAGAFDAETFEGPADAGPSRDIDGSRSRCGNSQLESPEECDDGNKLNGDNCSDDCRSEAPGTWSRMIELGPPATGALESCFAYRMAGSLLDGIYIIDPDGAGERTPFDVYCDMTTDGGGFTVIAFNHNADMEPSGCVPIIASIDARACGTIDGRGDFARPAYGIPFDDLVFAAMDEEGSITAFARLGFAPGTLIPNAELFLLPAMGSATELPGVEVPQIGCITARVLAPFSVLANVHPGTGAALYSAIDVVTVFGRTSSAAISTRMSFTDAHSGSSGSPFGLDDFQDGTGCGDLWEPRSQRGASTRLMIR